MTKKKKERVGHRELKPRFPTVTAQIKSQASNEGADSARELKNMIKLRRLRFGKKESD